VPESCRRPAPRRWRSRLPGSLATGADSNLSNRDALAPHCPHPDCARHRQREDRDGSPAVYRRGSTHRAFHAACGVGATARPGSLTENWNRQCECRASRLRPASNASDLAEARNNLNREDAKDRSDRGSGLALSASWRLVSFRSHNVGTTRSRRAEAPQLCKCAVAPLRARDHHHHHRRRAWTHARSSPCAEGIDGYCQSTKTDGARQSPFWRLKV
jgi:hypothetical protein